MRNKVSPTFVVAGVVVALSCFVLLSMLFYSPADYFERASQVAESSGGGLRFSIAAAFFKPFGVAAYIAWTIVLLWAVIVFFKEAVGELALRGASLVVVVVSGAALAHLTGDGLLGGKLGYTIGSFTSYLLGNTLGALLMAGIFVASFLFATDFGFITYFREARAALEPPEEDESEVDIVAAIERTAREVEEESTIAEAGPEDVELAIAVEEEEPRTEIRIRDDDEPLRLNLRPKIEEEALDEDLLVRPPKAVADAETAVDPATETEAEAGSETEPEEEEEELLAIAVASLERALAEREAEVRAEEEPTAGETPLPPDLENNVLAVAGSAPDIEDPVTAEPGTEPADEARAEEEEGVTPSGEPVWAAPAAEEVEEPVAEAPEPEVALREELEEPSESPAPARRDAMKDLDSVFDALVGLAGDAGSAEPEAESEEPAAAEPATPEAVEEAPEAEAPVAEAEEEQEEPETATEPERPFDEESPPPAAEVEEYEVAAPSVLLEDEFFVAAAEEEEAQPPAVEEASALAVESEEAAPAVSEAPAAEAPAVEEPAFEPAEHPVVLLDDEIAAPAPDEDRMLPFMDEEPEVETAMAPAAESEPESEPETASAGTEEPGEEIPVLVDVAAESPGAGRGGLRSLFGKRKPREKGADRDPLIPDAARIVLERGRASVVLLQRRLDIGYTRASRLVDAMEREGLVGPLEESGSRPVRMTAEEWRRHLGE